MMCWKSDHLKHDRYSFFPATHRLQRGVEILRVSLPLRLSRRGSDPRKAEDIDPELMRIRWRHFTHATKSFTPPSHLRHQVIYTPMSFTPPLHLRHQVIYATKSFTPPRHLRHQVIYAVKSFMPPSHVRHQVMYTTKLCMPPSDLRHQVIYATHSLMPLNLVKLCHVMSVMVVDYTVVTL